MDARTARLSGRVCTGIGGGPEATTDAEGGGSTRDAAEISSSASDTTKGAGTPEDGGVFGTAGLAGPPSGLSEAAKGSAV
jgi:hypothetical protein